jgi:hypothetical protein
MNNEKEFDKTREQRAAFDGRPETALPEDGLNDPELEQALCNFRNSVHAWSEAELSRPRTVQTAVHRASWRLAAGWALGCVLVVGGASAGVHERNVRIERAKMAAQQEAEHQRQLAAQRAKEDEELLAKVDSDISKEVPAAMEPLAQLMAEDETQ